MIYLCESKHLLNLVDAAMSDLFSIRIFLDSLNRVGSHISEKKAASTNLEPRVLFVKRILPIAGLWCFSVLLQSIANTCRLQENITHLRHDLDEIVGCANLYKQEVNDLHVERNMLRLEINKLSKLREENIATMERDKTSIQDLREQNADVVGKWNQAVIDLVPAHRDLNEALETLQESNTEVRSALGYINVLLMRIKDLRGQLPVEEDVDGTVE